MSLRIQDIETHARENNQESENHLGENHEKFSKQCIEVLRLLKSGVRLTVKSAMLDYGIHSLPRRLLDLKESGVKEIQDKWLIDKNGKRTVKEWFIELPQRPTKKEIIEKTKKYINQELKFPE